MLKKLALICMISLIAATSFAAVLEMGTRELILQGNVDFDDPDGNTTAWISCGLGYFPVDDIEVGPMVFLGYNGDDMGYGLGAFTELNLDLEMPLVPYFALRGLYRFGDDMPDNFVVGTAAVGLKLFLSYSVAVSTEVYYDYASEDVFMRNNKLTKDDAGINLGVRCFF